MADDKRYCEKCGRILKMEDFYQSSNLEKYPDGYLNICKKCIAMHVDNFDSKTYAWILQEIDVPYIPDEWNKLLARYGRDRSKLTGTTILGRYLAKMKLRQFKDFHWADNEFIQQMNSAKIKETMEKQGYSIQQITQVINTSQIDVPSGELDIPEYDDIPQAGQGLANFANLQAPIVSQPLPQQYGGQQAQPYFDESGISADDAEMAANGFNFDDMPLPEDFSSTNGGGLAPDAPQAPVYNQDGSYNYQVLNQQAGLFDDEDDADLDLTDDDKKYLKLKWGRTYRPSEWVQLEQLYNDMTSSYDIQSAGDINTLKLMCKTSLKANQLLDLGDVDGAQKMSKVYDGLMKSGKWTAAQNKTAENELVDSIGELVALCEKDGFFPRYYVDQPQDKVDRVIQDMQIFTRTLVTEELGLGNLIENSIKNLEKEKESIEAAAEAGEESTQDAEDKMFDYDTPQELTLDDYKEFNEFEDDWEEEARDAYKDQDGDY